MARKNTFLLYDLLQPELCCISRMSLNQNSNSNCWSHTLSLLCLATQGAVFRSPTLYLIFLPVILSSSLWGHLSPHNHSSAVPNTVSFGVIQSFWPQTSISKTQVSEDKLHRWEHYPVVQRSSPEVCLTSFIFYNETGILAASHISESVENERANTCKNIKNSTVCSYQTHQWW